MLPAGIKQHTANVLQLIAKQINATFSGLNLSVDNSVIVNNAIIKVTCIWVIVRLRMKIGIVIMEQKMNNLLDVMRLFVVFI